LSARVVLTGDMSTDKAELKVLAEQAGLTVTSSVSGKTALLVAADP
jgi:DNA polymerase III subunit epsilon